MIRFNMIDKPKYRFVTSERTRHGKVINYFRRNKGVRIRLPDDKDSEEFKQAYQAAWDAIPIGDVRNMPVTAVERRKQRTEATLRGSFRSARTRARTKGVPFDLTLDFLLDLALEQEFRCRLTGIEFFANNDANCRVDPFIPSIDRIVPERGYVQDNVRLVIYALNAM